MNKTFFKDNQWWLVPLLGILMVFGSLALLRGFQEPGAVAAEPAPAWMPALACFLAGLVMALGAMTRDTPVAYIVRTVGAAGAVLLPLLILFG